MRIRNWSVATGKLNEMEIDITPEKFRECFLKWGEGAVIQDAFPMFTANEREFLLTGITPEEWNRLYGED